MNQNILNGNFCNIKVIFSIPGSCKGGSVESDPLFFISIFVNLMFTFPAILFALERFGNSIEPVSALNKSDLEDLLEFCFLITI